jgi:hypothetical protein
MINLHDMENLASVKSCDLHVHAQVYTYIWPIIFVANPNLLWENERMTNEYNTYAYCKF